jgi:hypothetical protein
MSTCLPVVIPAAATASCSSAQLAPRAPPRATVDASPRASCLASPRANASRVSEAAHLPKPARLVHPRRRIHWYTGGHLSGLLTAHASHTRLLPRDLPWPAHAHPSPSTSTSQHRCPPAHSCPPTHARRPRPCKLIGHDSGPRGSGGARSGRVRASVRFSASASGWPSHRVPDVRNHLGQSRWPGRARTALVEVDYSYPSRMHSARMRAPLHPSARPPARSKTRRPRRRPDRTMAACTQEAGNNVTQGGASHRARVALRWRRGGQRHGARWHVVVRVTERTNTRSGQRHDPLPPHF